MKTRYEARGKDGSVSATELAPAFWDVVMRSIATAAAAATLDGIDGVQPLMLDRIESGWLYFRQVIFDVPSFRIVTGWSASTASGELLWHATFDPPYEYGAQGGIFLIPEPSLGSGAKP
jgi:hypothetical protein